jgi:phosphohistidine phosphatase
MPLQLYLLRHAQSADRQNGQSDKVRELTPMGIKNALLMGTYLQTQKLPVDIIVTSPSERTLATSRLVADALKLDLDKIFYEEELYEASTRTFLEVVNKLDDSYQNILCVGHNPVISYLAEYLSTGEIGDMTPAGLAIIKFNFNTWKEVGQATGELINYVSPEQLDFRNQ